MTSVNMTESLTPKNILTHWHTHGALWLMEEPDLIAKHIHVFAQTVAQCSDEAHHLPLLEDLVGYPYNTIRVAIAQNPHTPAHVLEKLFHSPPTPPAECNVFSFQREMDAFERLRLLILKNPNVPTYSTSILAEQ